MELHYDDDGILTDGDVFENNELSFTYSFELDENGNILRYISTDTEGNLLRNCENKIVPVYE